MKGSVFGVQFGGKTRERAKRGGKWGVIIVKKRIGE